MLACNLAAELARVQEEAEEAKRQLGLRAEADKKKDQLLAETQAALEKTRAQLLEHHDTICRLSKLTLEGYMKARGLS